MVKDTTPKNISLSIFAFFTLLLIAPVSTAGVDLNALFGSELPVIRTAAERNQCTGELFYILLAIRKAENGRKGLEFGVMHPKAKDTDLDTQAGWAAATIVKNYKRWNDAGRHCSFILFLGRRYCPVGADNDNGTNKYWVKNVTHWYERILNRK